MKCYVLSRMSRDILAIPMLIVSSESAFNNGGRVLDQFRSSLHTTTVEALICTQNWIKNPKKNLELCDEMKEVEKVESSIEKFSGLSSNLEVRVQSVFNNLRSQLGL